MQSVAILCRVCGAPSEGNVGTLAHCHYCGSDTPLDGPMRQRLARLVARTQRSSDKARSLLRTQIIAQLLPAAAFRMQVYLYGGLALALLVGPAIMAVGMLPFAFLQQLDSGTANVVGVLGVAVVAIGIFVTAAGFGAGVVLALRENVGLHRRASRSAREVESYVDTMATARCTGGGGHAQIVVLGQGAGVACPWCGATLLPASGDAAKLAAQGVLLAAQKTSDAMLRRAWAKAGPAGRAPKYRQIPGFVYEAGVYHGTYRDVPVWLSFDLQESGFHCRVEVEQDTRLPGAVWFVRRESAQLHAELLSTYKMRQLPQVTTEPDVDARFAVFADDGVDAAAVGRSPSVRRVLVSLGSEESVRLDSAGASRWRIGTKLPSGTNDDWRRNAATLVDASSELA